MENPSTAPVLTSTAPVLTSTAPVLTSTAPVHPSRAHGPALAAATAAAADRPPPYTRCRRHIPDDSDTDLDSDTDDSPPEAAPVFLTVNASTVINGSANVVPLQSAADKWGPLLNAALSTAARSSRQLHITLHAGVCVTGDRNVVGPVASQVPAPPVGPVNVKGDLNVVGSVVSKIATPPMGPVAAGVTVPARAATATAPARAATATAPARAATVTAPARAGVLAEPTRPLGGVNITGHRNMVGSVLAVRMPAPPVKPVAAGPTATTAPAPAQPAPAKTATAPAPAPAQPAPATTAGAKRKAEQQDANSSDPKRVDVKLEPRSGA